jgi:hypothetical protein
MKEFLGAGTDAAAAPTTSATPAEDAAAKGTESEDDLFKEMMQAGGDGGKK